MNSPQISASAKAVPYSRIRELAELAMKLDAESPRAEDKVLRLYFADPSEGGLGYTLGRVPINS
ncbi:MAG: hypothetical protein K2Q23_16415, partial [Bryobacteraceae bacterium]|nr:hypothetical protein [Bryobacteraceae bacterium]